MVIHEGEYLGSQLKSVYYVLLNALGLLWMLATGASVLLKSLGLPDWLRRKSKPSEE